MDMLETHEIALESDNVTYHEFLLCYKVRGKTVYGFVEGKDDPSFYRGLIENNLPDGWEIKLIRSGNKDKVLKVFKKMDWSRYPKRRICFFIDRDLSEFLGGCAAQGDNLYITDNYSIENEAINFRTMERILEEVFDMINFDPGEVESLRSLFEANLRTFSEAMVSVMAQILIWRRSGVNAGLDNIEPKEFFFFENGQIRLKQEFSSPEDRVRYAALRANANKSKNYELDATEYEFRQKKGPEKFIRGKYLLWFFVQCGKSIHQSTPLFCSRYKEAPKPRIGLGGKNAIIVIAPRVKCPSTLKTFIEYNYSEYIKEAAFTGN